MAAAKHQGGCVKIDANKVPKPSLSLLHYLTKFAAKVVQTGPQTDLITERASMNKEHAVLVNKDKPQLMQPACNVQINVLRKRSPPLSAAHTQAV